MKGAYGTLSPPSACSTTNRKASAPGASSDADRPAYYKLGFQFDEAAFGLSRQRFVAALQAEGIAFDEGFRALHAGRSPSRFRRAGDLAEADRAHRGAVVLHHPTLLGSEADVSEVATAVRKIYANVRHLAAL